MVTIFERIPDIFIEAYDFQFKTWAREYRVRGRKCAIVFKVVPGAPPLLDGNGCVVLAGCWLVADPEADGMMIIRPASEHDAELIARHVSELKSLVLQ